MSTKKIECKLKKNVIKLRRASNGIDWINIFALGRSLGISKTKFFIKICVYTSLMLKILNTKCEPN
jgi:hypothetical protein